MQSNQKHETSKNMTPPKKHNFPVTEPKEVELYKLPEKEFKAIILRKPSAIQENTNRQQTQENNAWTKQEFQWLIKTKHIS